MGQYVSSEHMPLPQGYTYKLAPKQLGSDMIDKGISSVAYWVDLPLKYRWLHPVFHASYLKPYIGPAFDTELPVVLGDEDVESEYKVEQVWNVQNIKQG